MIPVAAAGTVGLRILRALYKGKKWIGKGSKSAASFAAQKGHPHLSTAITGASQKTHKATKYITRKIKNNPKSCAAIGGAVVWDILDKD